MGENVIKKRNDFGNFIKDNCLNRNIVEIGVNYGNFSQVLVDTANVVNLYLVDPWQEDTPNAIDIDKYGDKKNQDAKYNLVLEKFKKYSNVKAIRKESMDAVNDFDDGYFDFIYIDALHEYKHVKSDLNAWYPKLKDGGLFAGHDYKRSRAKLGLCNAVDEFAIKNNKMVMTTVERCPSWYFFK